MDNSGYIGLSRQAGLLRELNAVANNIANADTNGYRREGAIFAEHVKSLGPNDPSLSIPTMSHRYVDLSAGKVTTTDNPLDLAIEGDGFFIVETPNGERLSRDGAFSVNAENELVNANGMRVLDNGGGSITIPPEATSIAVTGDGVLFANNQAIGEIGLATADPAFLVREGSNLFRAENGFEPATEASVQQNALERSNVSAIVEMARLIEVQRTYEAGQRLIQNEDDRIKRTLRALGQQ